MALHAPGVQALEALDGRIQAHGFFESQLRVISQDFSEEYDLAQWYQVFNLELEMDILPDGWGYIDLLQAYVRLEARYDCIYSRGCGMFRGADAYGDRAKNLPPRLANAHDDTTHGAILLDRIETRTNRFVDTDNDGVPDTTQQTIEVNRYGDRIVTKRDPAPVSNREPFALRDAPGFSGLGTQSGADGYLGSAPQGVVPPLLSPNPGPPDFQKAEPGGAYALRNDDPFDYVFGRFDDFRFTATGARGGSNGGLPINLYGPWLPKNFIFPNATLADINNPFDSTLTNDLLRNASYNGAIYSDTKYGIDFSSGDIEGIVGDPAFNSDTFFENRIINDTYSQFVDANLADLIAAAEIAEGFATGTVNSQIVFGIENPSGPTRVGTAKPFRPVPFREEAGRYSEGDAIARGLYLPSRPLRAALASGDLDPIPLNFRESQRAWNRGSSQQDEKELKEAFIDIETWDSRLWLRLGKQNIVWGKTELFRTTDQFNPVDLALVTLGNLEETRIALWSARAVLSLYEVGPLEDVRVEVAANLDQFEANDFGACGEPFTPNPVCSASFGIFAHGLLGIGLAGADAPPSPWEDASKIEFGGRVEFRWDRFSFAIADFYGYEDLPYVDRISTYSRNVDPDTGRMRAMGATGPCTTQPVSARQRAVAGIPFDPDPDCLQAGAHRRANFDPFKGENTYLSNAADPRLVGLPMDADSGIVGDLTNPTSVYYSPNNALDAHPANQQFFAVICAGTIGVSSLDPAACAGTIFGSQQQLPRGAGLFTTSQVLGSFLVASSTGVGAISSAIDLLPATVQAILARANRDLGDGEFGSLSPEETLRPGDIPNYNGTVTDSNGVVHELNAGCIDNAGLSNANAPANSRAGIFSVNRPIPCHSGGGSPAASLGQALGQLLSPQQQALLGCGPFFGTNCDDSGIGLLNAEASVLVQSWPGFEGTGNAAGGPNFRPGVAGASLPREWTLNNRKFDGTVIGRALRDDGQDLVQPGTLFFRGGPVGTVYDPRVNDTVVLPGARSPFLLDDRTGTLSLNPDYNPVEDGCIGGAGLYGFLGFSGMAPADCANSGTPNNPLHILKHPLSSDGGSTQFFRSEMAAVSWNFLMLLAANDSRFDSDAPFAVCRPDPNNPTMCLLDAGGSPLPTCSFATPQHCSTVRGILGLAGVQRNVVRAGGDGTFGRRTFTWHSGGEAILSFERRNVLGFSFDFAEDITKSNIGFEATWIPGVPRGDANSFTNVTRADDYNITVSIDRPTFVNFLNANRTFFFNAQFFFQYRDGWKRSFGGDGPWNLLGTFSVLAGFFQDRLLPTVTFVYDVQTKTSAVLPQIQYRYTEAFSIVVGAQFFAGNPQIRPISVNGIGPAGNEFGPLAYKTQADNGVAIVRSIDNLFVRLRYSF